MKGFLKTNAHQKDVVFATMCKRPVDNDNLRKAWVLEERRPKDSHLDIKYE